MAALCCYSHLHLRRRISAANNTAAGTCLSHHATYLALTKTKGGTVRIKEEEEAVPLQKSNPSKRQRREILVKLAAGLVSLPLVMNSPLALADDDPSSQDFSLYVDNANKFKLMIPPDWKVGSGEGDGIRSLTAFYPEDPSSTSNVSVVITLLGADYTKLESFGKVGEFAQTLVSGIDRSWQRPPGVAAKLVDSRSSGGLYYIEYTLQNPGESRRHLFSVLGISDNGVYNRLYTLTGQYVEEEAEKYSSTIKKAVASFRVT